MRWVAHVACMIKMRVHRIKSFDRKTEGSDYLEYLRVDGRIILTLILKMMGGYGMDSAGRG
jgi:hypothetical protein